MTSRTIVALALAATALLALGAWLLDAPTPGTLAFAALALAVGTALAAAAVAGAWRPVTPDAQPRDVTRDVTRNVTRDVPRDLPRDVPREPAPIGRSRSRPVRGVRPRPHVVGEPLQ